MYVLVCENISHFLHTTHLSHCQLEYKYTWAKELVLKRLKKSKLPNISWKLSVLHPKRIEARSISWEFSLNCVTPNTVSPVLYLPFKHKNEAKVYKNFSSPLAKDSRAYAWRKVDQCCLRTQSTFLWKYQTYIYTALSRSQSSSMLNEMVQVGNTEIWDDY